MCFTLHRHHKFFNSNTTLLCLYNGLLFHSQFLWTFNNLFWHFNPKHSNCVLIVEFHCFFPLFSLLNIDPCVNHSFTFSLATPDYKSKSTLRLIANTASTTTAKRVRTQQKREPSFMGIYGYLKYYSNFCMLTRETPCFDNELHIQYSLRNSLSICWLAETFFFLFSKICFLKRCGFS